MISLGRKTGRKDRPRRVVAVDFDSRQIRVVHARRAGRGLRIVEMAATGLSEVSATLESAPEVGAELGKLLRRMGLDGAPLWMCVPRGQAVLKTLTLPAGTPEEEIAGMVQYQVAGELPFRPEEAVIDFAREAHQAPEAVPTGGKVAEGFGVLVAAVRVTTVDSYRQIARAAGCRLAGLNLRPHANVRCVQACTVAQPGEVIALVQLSADETEIDVIEDGQLAFSRSAGQRMGGDRGPVHRPLRGPAEVAGEISRSLQSYFAAGEGGPLTAVLVAGDTSTEDEVVGHLAERLGVPCEMLQPGAAFHIGDSEGNSAFVSALGLASGAIGGQLPFDFADPKRPTVKRDPRRLIAVTAAVAVVALIVGGTIARQRYLGAKRQRLQKLQKEIGELETRTKNYRTMTRQLEDVRAWTESRHDWLAHWANLHALFPPAGEAYITASGLQTSGAGAISFTVRARDAEVIDRLGDRLREAGYDYKTGRVATESDGPAMYPHSTEMKVFVKSDQEVPLAELTPAPRPADDMSAEVMHNPPRRNRRRR